jgi:hypothetical protein
MAKATLQLPFFFLHVEIDMKCYDCQFWVGRCLKGKLNRIAISESCELFKPKKGVEGRSCTFEATAANFHRKRGLKLASGLRAKPAPPSHKTLY